MNTKHTEEEKNNEKNTTIKMEDTTKPIKETKNNKKQSKPIKSMTFRKIATLFICYTIAIFLLGFNTTQNKNTIQLLENNKKSTNKNQAQNEGETDNNNNNNTKTTKNNPDSLKLSNYEGNPNCHVDKSKNIVTILCHNNIKKFSLGSKFNYSKCNFDY